MIELYHPKTRKVRKVKKEKTVVLRCLKRAGFKVGKLPALKVPAVEIMSEQLPPTEEELEAAGATKEPVMAEHGSVVPEAKEEELPFSELNMAELRELAEEHGIVIPFLVRSKVAIAAYLAEEISKEEEIEEEADEVEAVEEAEDAEEAEEVESDEASE